MTASLEGKVSCTNELFTTSFNEKPIPMFTGLLSQSNSFYQKNEQYQINKLDSFGLVENFLGHLEFGFCKTMW